MRDCDLLSDRMPAVALGLAEWSSDEARHLAGCESCRKEWKLLQSVNDLTEQGAPKIDVSAMASKVQRRLRLARAEKRRQQRAWGFTGLATAAGLAAVLWTHPPTQLSQPSAPPAQAVAGRLQIPLPELEGLQPSELDSLLHTMDEPTTGGSSVEVPGLGELDDIELTTVLDPWEG
jgi:anti-sigma factor RsiW